jgi:signal transduction histidine kinase
VRRIQEINRLALAFSLYVFVALTVVFAVFIFIYQNLVYRQNSLDFERETREIIENHLQLDPKGLQFVLDADGKSLKEQLTTEGMSALFTDASGQVIRQYGLFALTYGQVEAAAIQSWVSGIQTANTAKVLNGSWLSQSVQVFVVPLRRDGQLLGVMLLARSQSELQSYSRLMWLTMAALLACNLVLSFGVGTILARGMLRPVRNIAKQVRTIDLDHIETDVGFLGHPSDATHQLAVRIDEMLLRLKSAAEKQRAFVAQASHELKTPLTRIISTLELGMQKPNEYRSRSSQAVAELFKLSELIDQLLLVARLDNDKVATRTLQSIDFRSCINEILDQLQIPQSSQKVAITITGNEKEKIAISPVFIKVILRNLIQNALKYTASAGLVTIEVDGTSDSVRMSVVDNGIGIQPAEVTKITDHFYRGQGAAQTKPGYGIGLALVKQICHVFAAELQIESQVGIGTRVTVIFPRK